MNINTSKIKLLIFFLNFKGIYLLFKNTLLCIVATLMKLNIYLGSNELHYYETKSLSLKKKTNYVSNVQYMPETLSNTFIKFA